MALFKCLQFYHRWPLGQKSVIQIFERRSGCKIIKQNVPGGLILVVLASCIASILKRTKSGWKLSEYAKCVWAFFRRTMEPSLDIFGFCQTFYVRRNVQWESWTFQSTFEMSNEMLNCPARIYPFAGHLKFSMDMSGEIGRFCVLWSYKTGHLHVYFIVVIDLPFTGTIENSCNFRMYVFFHNFKPSGLGRLMRLID